MNQEVWRSIDKYDGYYEVSSHGRVRSLARRVPRPPCGRSKLPSFTSYPAKVLIPGRHTAGYPQYQLHRNGVTRTACIHRLVAENFIPGVGDQVRHMDGDPTNNHVSNLCWGSGVDNEADKRDHGRIRAGESHHNCYNLRTQSAEILRMRAAGLSQVEIAKHFGVSRNPIQSILYRELGHG